MCACMRVSTECANFFVVAFKLTHKNFECEKERIKNSVSECKLNGKTRRKKNNNIALNHWPLFSDSICLRVDCMQRVLYLARKSPFSPLENALAIMLRRLKIINSHTTKKNDSRDSWNDEQRKSCIDRRLRSDFMPKMCHFKCHLYFHEPCVWCVYQFIVSSLLFCVCL